eukprot:355101-Chlamydomonas_euryale.AAC.7
MCAYCCPFPGSRQPICQKPHRILHALRIAPPARVWPTVPGAVAGRTKRAIDAALAQSGGALAPAFGVFLSFAAWRSAVHLSAGDARACERSRTRSYGETAAWGVGLGAMSPHGPRDAWDPLLATTRQLQKAFHAFDVNGNGTIELSELTEVLRWGERGSLLVCCHCPALRGGHPSMHPACTCVGAFPRACSTYLSTCTPACSMCGGEAHVHAYMTCWAAGASMQCISGNILRQYVRQERSTFTQCM